MLIDLSRVRVSGPLSGLAIVFSDYLTQQGYKPKSARKQLYLLNHLSNWLARERLGIEEFREKEAERFQRDRYAAGCRSLSSMRAMQPIFRYLRDSGTAPAALPVSASGAIDAFVEQYHTYLTVERGIRDETACWYVRLIHPLLQTMVLPDGQALDFRSLAAADVVSFVVRACPKVNPGMAGMTVTALRSLLRFLYVDGAIDQSLLSAVPTVPARRLAGLPKALTSDQVKLLLASCDPATPTGRRDLAVLTMLVRLGLRSGEVAKLRLDDIDWRLGEIVITQSKGNCTERIPLPMDVGEVVAAYLRNGRPRSESRAIFIAAVAPHTALTNSAVSVIVARAARRCGLGRVHAHRLRHTAATLMLRGGASLREIGQLLRHRNSITTAIYAKVDRDVLRSIARPWPGDVA